MKYYSSFEHCSHVTFPNAAVSRPRNAVTLNTVKFFDQIVIQCVQNNSLLFVVFFASTSICAFNNSVAKTVVGLVDLFS